MQTYKIYKCTNKCNGKIYIGYTQKKLEKRIIEHKCSANKGGNQLLHKANKKYAIESFEWEVILESKDQQYTLNEMESYFINQYNSFYEFGFGYNMTYGGQGGMTGRTHSIETKKKLKESRNKSSFQVRNPNGIGLDKAVIKAAEMKKGSPSWNKGKSFPQISGNKNGGGNVSRGKTWIKDPVTNKRVWV